MPYPAIAPPVAGTVITAAWEIANPLAAVAWLRQLMGNADPPASTLALISSSTTSGSWAKIPPDALAPGAVVAHLTYTPVNQAGDSMTGDLAAPGFQAGAHGVNGGAGGINASTGGYAGGSTTAGVPNMLGANVGASGVNVQGNGGIAVGLGGGIGVTGGGGIALSGGGSVAVAGGGGISVSGGGWISGGTTTAGPDLNVMGLNVGVHGVASAGPLSATGITASGSGGVNAGSGPVQGGSITAGIPSVLGLNVGTQGLALGGVGPIAGATSVVSIGTVTGSRLISTVAPGTAPLVVASSTVVPNLNAQMLADQTNTGRFATSVGSSPNAIPVADAAGKLDAWISASGLAGVPSNLIAAVAIAAQIPTGWLRYSTMDGLMPVGAGTTFGVTFTENTGYGASWSHGHADGGVHAHGSGGLFASGTTDNNNGSNSAQLNPSTPGFVASPGPHTHGISSVPVGGNTANNGGVATSSDRWIIPCRAIVWVIKT